MIEIVSMSVWRAQKIVCNLKRKGKKFQWGYYYRGKMYRYIKIKAR